MARPEWIPKDVWKFIKHGKRPPFIPKPVWKLLKAGIKNPATKEAVKILVRTLFLLK